MKRIREFWRLLNLPCEDMTALISRAMDAELPFRERFAYKLHLLYCRACRRYLRQVRVLREQLGRIRQALDLDAGDPVASSLETAPLDGADPSGPRLPEAARTRIRENIRKQ